LNDWQARKNSRSSSRRRLTVLRSAYRLERGREHASTLEEFRAVADQAIAGLDQSLTTITALLRITEIEHSRRREGFSEVQLAPLIREVGDLYDPIQVLSIIATAARRASQSAWAKAKHRLECSQR
jgi:hypothetical protein